MDVAREHVLDEVALLRLLATAVFEFVAAVGGRLTGDRGVVEEVPACGLSRAERAPGCGDLDVTDRERCWHRRTEGEDAAEGVGLAVDLEGLGEGRVAAAFGIDGATGGCDIANGLTCRGVGSELVCA